MVREPSGVECSGKQEFLKTNPSESSRRVITGFSVISLFSTDVKPRIFRIKARHFILDVFKVSTTSWKFSCVH